MKSEMTYQYLSQSLGYPDAQFPQTVLQCQRMLQVQYPEIAPEFASFTEFAASHSLDRMEEAYTRTFDIHAVCHLDVGYQLFGEDYKRGALLVELSRIQKEAGNDVGTELADHLPTLLRGLQKIKNTEERCELVRKLILPATEKMIASIPEDSGNVYRTVLKTIYRVLETDFGSAEPFPVQPDYSAEVEEAMHV